MESLSELALRCRVEGYRLGLGGEWAFPTSAIDRVITGTSAEHPYGFYSEEFQFLLRAMTAGHIDGYLAYAKESSDFVSPEKAAEVKGVAINTIYRLLRNPVRVQHFFGRSTSGGEDKRRIWYLHINDVKAWKPDERGRKRKATGTP